MEISDARVEIVWRVIFLWRFYGNSMERDTFYGGFMEISDARVEIVWRMIFLWRFYGNSMERDAFYGDFMIKLA